MIEFFIPVECRPKQSFRAGAGGVAYTPKPIKVNAQTMAVFAAKHRPREPINEPVSVEYVFQSPYLIRDKKARAAGATVPDETAPDLGNLEKQLEDVLENVGIVSNDARIWRKSSRKVRTLQAGVQVRIWTGDEP